MEKGVKNTMSRVNSMHRGLEPFIYGLFVIYTVLLPFENLTHEIWNLDTPFRPYRLIALFIGFLILFSRPLKQVRIEGNDLKLIAIYIFGLIPSFIAWTQDRFQWSYFLQTSLQFCIILWVFVLIKNLAFSFKQIYRMLHIFSVATLLNGVYMIALFIWKDIGRQSGMMDNPNFAAFTANIACVYFLYSWIYSEKSFFHPSRLASLTCIFILVTAVFVSGSRGALISLIISFFIFLIGVSARKRLTIVVSIAVLFFAGSQMKGVSDTLKWIPLLNRLETLTGKQEARTTLWKQGWVAFKDTGYMGLGIEQFKNPDNYARYVQTTENISVVSQAGLVLHNDFLTILFEFGPIAFLLLVSFYFSLWKDIWSIPSGTVKILSLILFMNVFVFACLDTTLQSHAVWFILLVLTLLGKNYRIENN